MWWSNKKIVKKTETKTQWKGRKIADIELRAHDEKQKKKFCPVLNKNCRLDCEFWVKSYVWDSYYSTIDVEEFEDKIVRTTTYKACAELGKCRKR